MELKFRRGHPSTQVTQGTSSMKERKIMITRRVEMERFSVVSSKPFQSVLAALKAAVGHPDMAEFASAAKGAERP
jgi:hypothetical protein